MEDYRLEQSGQEVQDILNGAAMQVDLTAETERAELAEQTLQGNIDIEERDRKDADLTLQGNIDAEELRAKAAEKQNADDIDALEEKVPSGASSSNKLATESYVDDSVATATATFRGTYNLVSDLHLTVDATEQQIATALALAISTADNNDYCFILVPTSSETPTEIQEIDRYKFNGTAWIFEYKLNNSGFTTAQWAAINSGITSGDVTKLAALPTNAELTTLLNGKQDVLTFDNVPTEGSSRPVKSGGVYSAIDDEKTARENADSSLSSAIEAILLLIPSAATSLNKLADKAFVNSSIATASATFRGTYNLVTDLSLTVSATHAQIATALAGAVSDEDNNDYAFVQIPTADATPTQIAKTERYKYNGTIWEYEYDLNNSGYTAAQWAAINSGITEALVTKLSALPTNAELTSALGVLTSSITTINQKIPNAASQANQLVDTAAMEAYIVQVLDVLTASFNVTSTDGHVTVSISQVDGKITSVSVSTSDIASAASLSLIAGRVTTAEGNISTNAADIANLQDAYAALTQSALVVVQPTDTWPVVSPATKTIYRVVDRVNTPPQYYSDYMWNGSAMVLMATYNNAIGDVPTAESNNLVKSGGVYEADMELERMSNSKDRIAIKHLNHGNFNGYDFSSEKFAANSGVINVNNGKLTKKLVVHHNANYAVVIWKGNGLPSLSNHFTMISNGVDQSGFLPDGFVIEAGFENIVILVVRDPLSGTDILTQQDIDNANAYIDLSFEINEKPSYESKILVESGGVYEADTEIEKLANDNGVILLKHIRYGNFVGSGFDSYKFAINSGVISLGSYPRKITVHHTSSHSVVLWKGSGIPSLSNSYYMIPNGIDDSGFLPDGFDVIIDEPNIIMVLVRNPLSGSDVLTQDDLDDANAYLEVSCSYITHDIRTKNSYGSLVEKWIYKFHKNSLLVAEHEFNDKSGLSWGAGGIYTDCFISDLFFPLMASPEYFALKDIENICEKFIYNRNGVNLMFPMSINLNGQVADMYSGADKFHYLPCGDATFFMPVILYNLYENYNSLYVFKKHTAAIEEALASIPVDTETHLVKIEAGHEWVPWGFEEISRFLGNVCIGSAFLYNAYIHLAKLFKVIGNTTKESEYNSKAQNIKDSMQDDSPLWDSENGMYYAATLQNKQIDIFGSAMCVAFDIASEEQKIAISDYIANNYQALTYGLGYCRQSNDGWSVCGDIPQDGSQNYIWHEFYSNGSYQNGLWPVANYWVLIAIAYHNENIAKNYANAAMNNLDPSTEWIAIPPAAPNPTPAPNNLQIMACAGTLQWVRENSFLL